MKNIHQAPLGLLACIILFFSTTRSFSQASVVSTAGYAVNIMVLPTSVLPSTTNCPWGYNYNLRINYSVTMTGVNIPASLYTLQGNIACNTASHFFDLPNGAGSGVVNSTSNQWNGSATCLTATVNSLNCNTARIQINGLGIASQTVSFPITYIALPVQLTGFSAAITDRKVRLNWSTATETNNEYFAIERSVDGDRWEELGRVPGHQNSTVIQRYEWYDENPLQGIAYYRLKQVDFDAKIQYSELKAVHNNNGRAAITIYPVPNPGNTITIRGLTTFANLELTVINSNGQLVHTMSPGSATVELPELKKGLYVIRIKDLETGETDITRYIKM